ncbi:tuberous sclerosis 2, partial [Lecanoromycetidae sp. Uapishka_2]
MRENGQREKLSLEVHGEWFKRLPEHQQAGPNEILYLRQANRENAIILDVSSWLDNAIDILDKGSDWEIYVYVLVHLPSQLSNRLLFVRHVKQLQTLHNILTTQLEKSSFYMPPQHTGISAGDVALCLFHILTVLVAYNDVFSRRELDSAVRTFSTGINKWDRVGKCCIDALALCCHEIPSVIDRHIFAIIQKMSQRITQADLAVDILEFLLGLARLPSACSSATAKLPETHPRGQGDDGSFFRTVFGICTKFIKSAREQSQEHAGATSERSSQRKSHQSGMSGKATHTSELNDPLDTAGDLSEYVYTLAYHVITFWFLSIGVRQRSQHVGWIAKELGWQEKPGKEWSEIETLDEQSQVILDMMHRTAYSDLGETEPAVAFKDPEQNSIKKTWLLGMSIITLEILPGINTGQFTKRQASGTTHALYSHTTATLPEHHVREANNESEPLARELIDVYPNHMFLQLASTIAPVPIPLQPVVLPDDEFTQRVLRNFDRIDTVDGHKAGVIYISEGQKSEAEILANTRGTEAYKSFLSGLGTSVKLEGAIFNTQGLDRESNTDGTHTYAWRDRVTEIVFHVTTMMPTDITNDPHSDSKKRHIGNDRVKIIYNDSGQPFDFQTFPSDFNEVNIVISPEAHTSSRSSSIANISGYDYYANGPKASASDLYGYYKVQMLCSPDFPYLSPTSSPKIISAEALPGFVRQLALNASVFCQVWSEVRGQGKYISSWRARLREIKRLREKYGNTHESANVSYPMPNNASTYVEGDEWTGRVAMGGMAEMNQLLMSLDFTRWT